MKSLMVVCAVLGLAGAAGAAEPAGAAKLYAKNCQSCHGPDGKGSPKMVQVLKVKPEDLNLLDAATLKRDDAALAKSVADGIKPKMPAYGKKLSARDIGTLVAYVRGLAAPGR